MSVATIVTLTDFAKLPANDGDIAVLAGHTKPGDGGGGLFYFSTTPVVAEDGGTVFWATKNPLLRPEGMWMRIYSGGLNVRWFGAQANGHDDSLAFQRALDHIANVSEQSPRGKQLFVPAGEYVLENTLVLKHEVVLEGESGSGRYAGSRLVFRSRTADRIDGIVVSPSIIRNGDVVEGGAWTIIRDLAVMTSTKPNFQATPVDETIPDDDLLIDKPGNGIVLYGRARVVDCFICGFPYDGVHIETTRGLLSVGSDTHAYNADNFEIHNCHIQGCGRHGVFIDGVNSNAGRIIGLDSSANGVWGVYESSFLGNTYLGCHCATNGHFLEPNEPHRYRGGSYKTTGGTNVSTFVNCYAEYDQPPQPDPTRPAITRNAEIFHPSIVVGGTFTIKASPLKAGAAWFTSMGNGPEDTDVADAEDQKDYIGIPMGGASFPKSVRGESPRSPGETYVAGLLGSLKIPRVAMELHHIVATERATTEEEKAAKAVYEYRLHYEGRNTPLHKTWWSWIYVNQTNNPSPLSFRAHANALPSESNLWLEMGYFIGEGTKRILVKSDISEPKAASVRSVSALENAAPEESNWRIGDRVLNSKPIAGGYAGWILTPIGWKRFGKIED